MCGVGWGGGEGGNGGGEEGGGGVHTAQPVCRGVYRAETEREHISVEKEGMFFNLTFHIFNAKSGAIITTVLLT